MKRFPISICIGKAPIPSFSVEKALKRNENGKNTGSWRKFGRSPLSEGHYIPFVAKICQIRRNNTRTTRILPYLCRFWVPKKSHITHDAALPSPTLPEAQSFSIFFLMLFPPLIPRFLIILLKTDQLLLIVFHVPHVRLNGFVFCPRILFRTLGLTASADGCQSK